MNVDKLTTALTITFVVSVAVLFAELLFVLRRRLPPSSQPPNYYYSAKELLYFFGLKSQTRVVPSEPPAGNLRDDPVIDVFKLLEANGPSRVLCTIKEDDREEIESTTSMSVVDSVEIPATENVSLQACLESEAAKLEIEVEGSKTVFSSPCDSPVFFTPMGSPS